MKNKNNKPGNGTYRVRFVVNLIKNYLKPNQKILDFGAGDCSIGQYLINHNKANVTSLDVVDYNNTKLKLVLYDGKKIPFSNDYFDTILIIFVLHHLKNQLEIINEAKRVAKRLIIIEDTPKNKIEWMLWRFWDWLLNFGHGVTMTYSFKSDEEWIKIYKRTKLKVINKNHFRSWFPVFGMYQQTIYVLEK